MKTPEENKCGMECIRSNASRVCVKTENGQCPRCEQLVGEALGCIKQLESRLAQIERERDAAVADLAEGKNCADCKHYYESTHNEPCLSCVADTVTKKGWQWRGVCDENTKEENK